jgi:heme A synthase
MAVIESAGFLAQPGKAHKWLKVISLLTVLSVFALIVLGGVVRVTGSGLGCPDWPLCHGKVLPPLEITAIIEYTHRLVASAIVGPLILVTCGTVWLAYRREKWLVIPATLAVFLLIGQALLGGVTVLNELPGEIVAAHLALGEALLACLLLVLVVAYRGPLALKPADAKSNSKLDWFPRLVLISAIGVYLLILTGSLVTATGATAACVTWPLCQGEVFPERLLPAIHMGHRFVAATIGALLLYTLYLGFQDWRRPLEVRLLSIGVAGLFTAQVIVGAVTVWLRFPVPLMALHLAMASAVWGATAALAVLSFTQPRFAGTTAQGAIHD